MDNDSWIALGAVGTAAGFFAITWQADRTRKAAKVAQDALIASQAVALDAARARLDAQAPEISVSIAEEVRWPPYKWNPSGMPVESWPDSHEWHFPATQEERIVLQARIGLENHSQRRITVEYDGDMVTEVNGRPMPATSRVLTPRQHNSMNPNRYLQKDFTIKQLAENYAARQEGRELPHRATGTITIHDDRDNGVTDTWKIDLTGCPVRPDKTRDGVWLIDTEAARDSLEYPMTPTYQRTYWISRQHQQCLPVPTYATKPSLLTRFVGWARGRWARVKRPSKR